MRLALRGHYCLSVDERLTVVPIVSSVDHSRALIRGPRDDLYVRIFWFVCFCPQVGLQVADDAPTRPVEEKKWLKPTGLLPLASNYDSDDELNYDSRSAEVGGCDSPFHFEGCQAYYVKVPVPV